MFGKLKEKLKSALSIFSKKTEEAAVETPMEKDTLITELIPKEHHPAEEKVLERATTEEVVEERKKKTIIAGKKETSGVPEKGKEYLPPKLSETLPAEKTQEKPLPKKTETALKAPEEIISTVKSPAESKPSVEEEQSAAEHIPRSEVRITYFVHGTTTDNEQDIATGWNPGELSAAGIQQSKDLHEKIKHLNFEVVFTSDLKRAVDSARLTFGDALPIIKDRRLREADYGEYTCTPARRFKHKRGEYVDKAFLKGESYKDIERRVAHFITFVYENYPGKRIAIVAHQAPQLAFEVLLRGKTWKEAIEQDWRRTKAWKPGWEYVVTERVEETPRAEELIQEMKEHFTAGKKEAGKGTEHILAKGPTAEQLLAEAAEVPDEEEEEELTPEEPGEIEEEKLTIPESPAKKSFFAKIKETFTTKIISTEKFEELFWELEVALLENNVSVEVIERIKDDLKQELVDKPLPRDVEGKIEETLKRTLEDILSFRKVELLQRIQQHQQKPYVIAFFGINGSGKTTSIAKLAHYLQQHGCSVVLAAGDTFRAAAIQQLEEHALKMKVPMIKHEYGSDAAAVAFDAVKYAEKNNIDVVLIDTAGRLHSNVNLMAELEKIIRVAKPHLKIFVGESLTGNDCVEQAQQFHQHLEMDGIILTKADVDEKGGAPLSIAYTVKKPIFFLGVGQRYEDLESFDREKVLQQLGL